MTTQDPHAFAAEWIEAWNTHDLERILSHYDTSIVFLSPLAKQRTGHGRVEGLDALRAYWAAGLAAQPKLRFEHRETLVGFDSLTILYTNHRGQKCAESFEFGGNGKVIRASASYGL